MNFASQKNMATNRSINVKTPYRANPTNALHVAFEANNETRSAAIF